MQTTYLDGLGPVVAVIRSIGVRHDGAHQLVTDGLYLDLRKALRNPADDPALCHRTGLDPEVYAHVIAFDPATPAGRRWSDGHPAAGAGWVPRVPGAIICPL